MVEKIKESRNVKNCVIIDFFSLKKYTTESFRPPTLVSPTLSLQYHRQSLIKDSKSPAILGNLATPPVPKAVVVELWKWRFSLIAVEIEKGRPKIKNHLIIYFCSRQQKSSATKNLSCIYGFYMG